MKMFLGDEELDHWRKIFKDMADSRNRNKFSRKRRHGKDGGRGGPRVKLLILYVKAYQGEKLNFTSCTNND